MGYMYKCVFISLDFGLLWIVCHIQFSDVLNYRNLGWGLGHIHDIYYCRIEGYIYYRLTRTSLYIVFYDKWIAIWFVVINLCFNHFNEKTCWTSEILGENSWKNLTFVVDEFFFRRQAPPTKPLQPAHQSKQQLSRIFSKNLWSSAGFLNS